MNTPAAAFSQPRGRMADAANPPDVPSTEETNGRIARAVIELSFVAAILLAVAGFGGNEPLSWSISQDLVFATAIAMLLRNREAKRNSRRIKPGSVALSALALWVFAQWAASRYGFIGFDSYAIKFRGLALATAATGFFIALELSRNRAVRNRLSLSLISLALFESLYGLAQNPGGWQYIWTYRRVYYTGSATGTYINHNHFAGLLEMILPTGLALALYHWSKAGPTLPKLGRGFRGLLARTGSPEILKSIVLLLIATAVFVAIAFSLSRMGLTSALFSVMLLGALIYGGRRVSNVNWKLLLACVGISVVVAAWIGAGPVMEHFTSLSNSNSLTGGEGEGRLPLWRDAAKLIRAHPITGIGLGCFEVAFTQYQSTELTLNIDHAHNDYLELAAEIGIPAAATVFALILSILGRAARASFRTKSRRDQAIGFGAIAGASALLVHGVVDFNFYIPANALVFAVILGVSYSLVPEERAGRRQLMH